MPAHYSNGHGGLLLSLACMVLRLTSVALGYWTLLVTLCPPLSLLQSVRLTTLILNS